MNERGKPVGRRERGNAADRGGGGAEGSLGPCGQSAMKERERGSEGVRSVLSSYCEREREQSWSETWSSFRQGQLH